MGVKSPNTTCGKGIAIILWYSVWTLYMDIQYIFTMIVFSDK